MVCSAFGKEIMKNLFRVSLVLATFSALVVNAHAQDINGGSSWSGWNSQGMSNSLGVYGSGSTTDIYEVYTSVFNFNNNSVSGGAVGGGPTGGGTGFGTGSFSTGAFANGDTILGLGVRRVSGSSVAGFTPTVRFDLDGDSYLAATSVGGVDGRTSFSTYSEFRDFTVQFEGANSWRGGTLSMQTGAGTFYGGPNNTQQIVGGIGSGVSYDWPFRAFAQTDSYQMFFDMNAMQAIYGTGNPNPFGLNSNFTGIGAFSSDFRVSLNGLGSNDVVINASTVPEPASMATLAFGVLVLLRRRKKA